MLSPKSRERRRQENMTAVRAPLQDWAHFFAGAPAPLLDTRFVAVLQEGKDADRLGQTPRSAGRDALDDDGQWLFGVSTTGAGGKSLMMISMDGGGVGFGPQGPGFIAGSLGAGVMSAPTGTPQGGPPQVSFETGLTKEALAAMSEQTQRPSAPALVAQPLQSVGGVIAWALLGGRLLPLTRDGITAIERATGHEAKEVVSVLPLSVEHWELLTKVRGDDDERHEATPKSVKAEKTPTPIDEEVAIEPEEPGPEEDEPRRQPPDPTAVTAKVLQEGERFAQPEAVAEAAVVERAPDHQSADGDASTPTVGDAAVVATDVEKQQSQDATIAAVESTEEMRKDDSPKNKGSPGLPKTLITEATAQVDAQPGTSAVSASPSAPPVGSSTDALAAENDEKPAVRTDSLASDAMLREAGAVVSSGAGSPTGARSPSSLPSRHQSGLFPQIPLPSYSSLIAATSRAKAKDPPPTLTGLGQFFAAAAGVPYPHTERQSDDASAATPTVAVIDERRSGKGTPSDVDGDARSDGFGTPSKRPPNRAGRRGQATRMLPTSIIVTTKRHLLAAVDPVRAVAVIEREMAARLLLIRDADLELAAIADMAWDWRERRDMGQVEAAERYWVIEEERVGANSLEIALARGTASVRLAERARVLAADEAAARCLIERTEYGAASRELESAMEADYLNGRGAVIARQRREERWEAGPHAAGSPDDEKSPSRSQEDPKQADEPAVKYAPFIPRPPPLPTVGTAAVERLQSQRGTANEHAKAHRRGPVSRLLETCEAELRNAMVAAEDQCFTAIVTAATTVAERCGSVGLALLRCATEEDRHRRLLHSAHSDMLIEACTILERRTRIDIWNRRREYLAHLGPVENSQFIDARRVTVSKAIAAEVSEAQRLREVKGRRAKHELGEIEQTKHLLKEEVGARGDVEHERWSALAIIRSQEQQHWAEVRSAELALEGERQRAAVTLVWTPEAHAAAVTAEEKARRAVWQEEVHAWRTEIVAESTRSYLAARRDESRNRDATETLAALDSELALRKPASSPGRYRRGNNGRHYQSAMAGPEPPLPTEPTVESGGPLKALPGGSRGGKASDIIAMQMASTPTTQGEAGAVPEEKSARQSLHGAEGGHQRRTASGSNVLDAAEAAPAPAPGANSIVTPYYTMSDQTTVALDELIPIPPSIPRSGPSAR